MKIRSGICATVPLLLYSTLAWGQSLTAVQSGSRNLMIKLDRIANVGATPIDAATIPGTEKLFVAINPDFTPPTPQPPPFVVAITPNARTGIATPFLLFANFPSVPVNGRGLLGITFSPHFSDPTQPGYHKFYTVEQEAAPASPSANVMFLHPEDPTPDAVGVLREWTAKADGSAIDSAIAPRIVLNFGTPFQLLAGGMKFGPDGYLYLGTGDMNHTGDGYSGSLSKATDGATGRGTLTDANFVPAIGNAQDFTNVIGKILRIDPYVTNGDGTERATGAGKGKSFNNHITYFVPHTNPFVDNPQNIFFTPLGPVELAMPRPPLEEIFAFGFACPWKLSFDKNAISGDLPYVADPGAHARDEIDRVQPGKNYGWPYREGDIASPTAVHSMNFPNQDPNALDRPGHPNGPIPFKKRTDAGAFVQYDSDPTLTDPNQMSLPIVRLGTRGGTHPVLPEDHGLIFADNPGRPIFDDGHFGNEWGDTAAVVGGFVYRGSAITELIGKYVFGGYEYLVDDPARASYYGAMSSGGRLFYFDPTEDSQYKTVKQFNYDPSGQTIPANDSGNVMGIVQGDDGELYVLLANGDVDKIIKHEPGANFGLGIMIAVGVALGIGAYYRTPIGNRIKKWRSEWNPPQPLP